MEREKRRVLRIMLVPPMVFIAMTTTIPFIFLFRTSLSSWKLNMPGTDVFVGLQNYVQLINDPAFWGALRVTVFFTVGAVSFEMVIGMIAAHLLARNFWGRRLARSIALIPMMMTPTIVGLIWRILYHPYFGVINYLLSLLHLPQPGWLSEVRLALPSVIITDIWEWTPFMTIMFLAGLQSLPREPFEAAVVDGASGWQVFRYVTLPSLRSVILIAASFRFVTAFRWFDTIFVMTAGGPALATTNLNIYAYLMGFKFYKVGYASAISVVVLMFVLVSTYLMLSRSEIPFE